MDVMCGEGGNHSEGTTIVPLPEKRGIFYMHSEKTGEFSTTLFAVLCKRASASADEKVAKNLAAGRQPAKNDMPNWLGAWCDVSFLSPHSFGKIHLGYDPHLHKGAAVTLIRDPVCVCAYIMRI
jgi:hypothetical protein